MLLITGLAEGCAERETEEAEVAETRGERIRYPNFKYPDGNSF